MSNEAKVRKNLTAQEARHLADTSFASLNDIYKLIKEAANYNRTQIKYSFDNSSKVAIENSVTILRDNGYSVEYLVYKNNIDAVDTTKEFYENMYNFVEIVISW